MGNLQRIVYLSEEEYQSLIDNNSITKNGVTINYSADDIYMTPATSGEEIVFDGEYDSVTNKAATVSTVTNALSNMTVTDVQVNGTSILSNGVANVPIANSSTLGVSKPSNSGIQINASGQLITKRASDNEVKSGASDYNVITPTNQHKSTFYGLAKAAGDSTQSASSNSVGTYTANAKGSIQDMLGIADLISTNENSLVASKAYNIGDLFVAQGNIYKATSAISLGSTIIPNGNCSSTNLETELKAKVDKDAIDNAGITARSYTTKFGGEFTVTTAETTGYISPYVRASVTGRINKHYLHRVTVNGTKYILQTKLWYQVIGVSIKVYEYLGNIGLYVSDTSGIPDKIDNVSFCIISDLNNSNSIDVLTSTAGTYTILVEQISNTQTQLPASLIYGDSYTALKKADKSGSTYNGTSMGVNELTNRRGTFAIGYCNKVSNEFSTAIGHGNIVSGDNAIAIGDYNEASGTDSTAIGFKTVSNATNMTAIGSYNIAANIATDWASNTLYHVGDVVYATVSSTRIAFYCKTEHTSSSSFLTDVANWSPSPSSGDTALAVGNGAQFNQRRSNAFKIDWAGNGYFMNDVYVGCDGDSTGGTKLAKVTDIPTVPVQDVKVNNTSVLSSGVANIPMATNSTPGVVIVNPTYGALTQWTSPLDNKTYLLLNMGNANDVKAGSTSTKPFSIARQHEATFYGLAKAAGDTTQSASSNSVGTYTANAQGAIQNMLGITNLISTDENSLVASKAYNIGDLFVAQGGIYKATSAISLGDTIIIDGNCVSTNLETELSAKANKSDTVLDTTLSRGRRANSTVGYGSFAFGDDVTASNTFSHAEGAGTTASGLYAHAEGLTSTASGYYSHAEGSSTVASGSNAHAEGSGTTASKVNSHAEGTGTTASGENSHAEGAGSQATGNQSHAEGAGTVSSGDYSHAEGASTTASGYYSHTEGAGTTASGVHSHAEGQNTIAAANSQHVSGEYNVEDTGSQAFINNWPVWVAGTSYAVGDKVQRIISGVLHGYICTYANSDSTFNSSHWIDQTSRHNYAEIIGNGVNGARSNARALDWDGNEYLAGDVYVGANADSTGGTKLAKVTDIPTVPVQDVQVNGTSILDQGVANVPLATANRHGVIRVSTGLGINSSGNLYVVLATSEQAKAGTFPYASITPSVQHTSTFYGLAKAAGDATQSASSNAVGTYTESAKSSIASMLNAPETVSGSTPSITAKAGVRYICGEVSTLDISVPASGIIDVMFESGSTPTVLTVTPPTGMTMKWANEFDPTSLEANTTYEINVMDGVYGVVGAWT